MRCYSCFHEVPEGVTMCPYCGETIQNYPKQVNQLVPGTMLKNQYVIGLAVGVGGFGITYRAWDTVLNRIVAIKEYYPSGIVNRVAGSGQIVINTNHRKEFEDGLYDFTQEAVIMGFFTNQENVVNSYDRFEENGTGYIVMEFLRGVTLKNYVMSQDEPLEESVILEIMKQVLSGLSEIHKEHVIHCDIAPDNIWLCDDGRIKIFDFGASKTPRVKRRFDTVIVKPGFAPPEQYREDGSKIGPWTDIYAVGATLYYLLTGEKPIEATDRQKQDTLLQPAQIRMVSRTANNVTTRALALSPELRYRSADEFLTELDNEQARSLKEELARRRKRRRRFLTAIFIVLFISAGIISWLGYTKDKIMDEQINVWVDASGDYAENLRSVLQEFSQLYPQIDVNIVEVDMKSASLTLTENNSFIKKLIRRVGIILGKDTNLPDVIQIGTEYNIVGLMQMDDTMELVGDSLLNAAVQHAIKTSAVPIGTSLSVVYAGIDSEGNKIDAPCDYEQFLVNASGYVSSSTYYYREVQRKVAGRYLVEPCQDKSIEFTDCFGVIDNSRNKRKAALAFLEFLLTENAQDIMFIQNGTNLMPVNKSSFNSFIGVFSELSFLSETDLYKEK